ncbi:MAG: cellulase family glycosylhydrolase [Chloroflexi bacterium]|nr:cellulase family glycosylhydrolase [Chloroflexota bacterium]
MEHLRPLRFTFPNRLAALALVLLVLGGCAAPAPAPTPTLPAAPVAPNPPAPSGPTPGPPPAPAARRPFVYGVQAHLWGTDRERAVRLAREAGFTWVKQQVRWDAVEPRAKGQLDWSEPDRIVAAVNDGGLKLLLSIVAAPGWATGNNPVTGPPNDYRHLADLLTAMAQRYKGRVHAYEVWNEQNLWYEWGGKGKLNAADYVRMLQMAYRALKAVDPQAVVIAGALTPTGVNDGVIAIDDLVYLEQMYKAGVKDVSDAVGAHPHGYNNPPDDWVDRKTVRSEAFKGHPSFYFRRVEQYRAVMTRYGDAAKPVWVTEFGWTTANKVPGYEYGKDVSEQEQASWIVRAFGKGRDEYPWLQAMFLWNLNFATVVPPEDEKFPWSVLGADWSPRPAYLAVKSMPK